MDPEQKTDERNGEAERTAASLGPGLIHELRQPLMGVQAGIELLARELGAGVTAREGFQLIVTQTQRLEQLMHGFKDLFAGTGATERFALQPVVERAVGLLRFRLRHLGSRFSVRDGPLEVFCLSRPGALLHALTNLMGNAIDAVDQAGAGGRLEIRVLARAGLPVEVRVSDEGSGIPAADRARLFADRFTTKAPGKGTGLGLQISRELMLGAGGDVRLVDEADPARAAWARTEFAIEVPRAP